MRDKIMIVGCGGMGTWVSMAVQFHTRELHVIDYDIVMTTNRNRLPMRVGHKKVGELERFITMCDYFPYDTEYSNNLLKLINPDIVIDCTDNLSVQRQIYDDVYTQGSGCLIRAGSNRHNITIATPPYDIWDNDGEDTSGQCGVTVPQHLETQLIAAGYVVWLVQHYRENFYLSLNILQEVQQ